MLLAPFGLIWAAASQVLAAATLLPIVLFLEDVYGGMNWRRIARLLLPAFAAAAAMAAIVHATGTMAVSVHSPVWATLAIQVVFGAAIYSLLTYGLYPSLRTAVRHQLRRIDVSPSARLTTTMDAYVVVATKGRPAAVAGLLDAIGRQTHRPRRIVIVGASAADVEGLSEHALVASDVAEILVTGRPGLTIQRNAGIARLSLAEDEERAFVTFFDDDFRPAADWLERAGAAFAQRRPHRRDHRQCALLMASTEPGCQRRKRTATSAASSRRSPIGLAAPIHVTCSSLYGCNMSFAGRVVRSCRFDEELPLYAWQEDRDYAGQARAFGRTIYLPACCGVHLGMKAGRTSGVRFGYSQIANPIYLVRKGTMDISDREPVLDARLGSEFGAQPHAHTARRLSRSARRERTRGPRSPS